MRATRNAILHVFILALGASATAQLIVVQGANDPRVKKAESDQIVVALRDRGFPVEYLASPDEGQGSARPVNNMEALAATEKFLARHLGGRFQEGATLPQMGGAVLTSELAPRTE